MSSEDGVPIVDDRFDLREIWRRPLRGDSGAAVRVVAKMEAGSVGPEEYAIGISTRADAQLTPVLDDSDLFFGLSFAEAHWVAAVLASAADRVEDAEALLFDLRVPVEMTTWGFDLTFEVIEPTGLRSNPLIPWEPQEAPDGASRYAIAIYTLECGHQAVELLRQDADASPFWVEDGSVDHLSAGDAIQLARFLHGAASMEEAEGLLQTYQANLAHHGGEDDDDDDDRA